MASAVATGDAAATSTAATLRRVYETLKAKLLSDPSFGFNEDAIQWLDAMLDYNVLGGKLNRGLAVVESYNLLKAGYESRSEEDVFLACILGWGIEWLQAYFLILDDIMDNSQIRRGKPCWYRLPKVGLIAINDGLILRSQISRIIKHYFYGRTYYVDLLDLFNEVEFKTTSGELLDLITTIEGRKDLSKYTVDIYRRIVEYKTAHYSFYLPVKDMFISHILTELVLEFGFTSSSILLTCYKVACALLLSGQSLDNCVEVKDILVEMGVYFQIQIGTDIEDFKCSWLFVQALEHANERQKDALFENYGKSDPACVAKVKALYKELNLERVFFEYERESYENLISAIEVQLNEPVKAVLKSFLHKIYKRRK